MFNHKTCYGCGGVGHKQDMVRVDASNWAGCSKEWWHIDCYKKQPDWWINHYGRGIKKVRGGTIIG